ncbi:MAG: T9SS type A sorting domain-containing protein [Bacteroidota bacterium]
MIRSLLLLSILAASPAVTAQECADAEAEQFLERSGVRAKLFNNGALFWSGGDHTYEVPRGLGTQAIFAAGLWIGGTVEGETRFAGSDYGPYEYWPGPLGPDGAAPTPASCAAYDRIWRVTLEDIARYNETGVATPDLAEWPAEVGAPVVDGDGIADNYDLAAGDRPAILGDETAWWIMNDRGDTHDWGETPAIGMEARVTAFSVSDAYARERIGVSDDLVDVFHTATLYRYELTYHGDAPLEDTYVGLFTDPDLGFFSDDYVGSFPEGEIGYVYNGDDFDEGAAGYGANPPALGVRMISGPAARPLTGAMYWNGSASVLGNPGNGEEAYRYLQSRWRDGSPATFGGVGYQTGTPTTYMFSDLPPGFWSEANIDGEGTANVPADRRLLMNHGPFTMQPGETVEVSFAIVFSRSPAGRFDSVYDLVLRDAPGLAAVAGTLTPDGDLRTIRLSEVPTPSGAATPPPPPGPEPPERFDVASTLQPNPTTGPSVLRIDLPGTAEVRMTIYDALGRQIAVAVDERLDASFYRLPVPTQTLAPGAYVYRLTVRPEDVTSRGIETTGRFTVIR